MVTRRLDDNRLGQYELIAKIGEGGMGIVYLARQQTPVRQVALKVARPEVLSDPQNRARFILEANAAAGLQHPNIVPIYEVGEAELHGQLLPYIAMAYVQGMTLRQILDQRRQLPLREATDLVRQVGMALDHAHGAGIVHRDFKPSNILIDRAGHPYLMDFGLARDVRVPSQMTVAGALVGTPEYMSPEQAEGAPTVGPASDIYALGLVLYEMLTGRLPFSGTTPLSIITARLTREVIPPRQFVGNLPPVVEEVVMRALKRAPEQRFRSAADLVVALQEAAQVAPKASAHPAPQPPTQLHTGNTTVATQDLTLAVSAPQQRAAQGQQSNQPKTVVISPPPLPPAGVGVQSPPPGGGAQSPIHGGWQSPPPGGGAQSPVPGGWQTPVPGSVTPRPPGWDATPMPGQKPKPKLGLWWIVGAVVLLLALVGGGAVGYTSYTASVSATATAVANTTASAIANSTATAVAEVTQTAQATRATATAAAGATQTTVAMNQAATAQARQTATAAPAATAAAFPAPAPELAWSGRPLFGPASGWLDHEPGGSTVDAFADVAEANLVVDARFLNPNDPAEAQWDYGFRFRVTNDREYRLVVSSLGNWRLSLYEPSAAEPFTTVQEDELDGLALNAGESNDLRLISYAGFGIFYLNGAPVASLDLSAHTEPGDLSVSTQLYTESGVAGAATFYNNFTLWPLDRVDIPDAELAHDDDGNIEGARVGDDFRDFILAVSFTNPYDAAEALWDYGVVFRSAGNEDYSLVIRSSGIWQLLFAPAGSEPEPIAEGQVPGFNAGAGGATTLQLVVNGASGVLYLNGELVEVLDLGANLQSGSLFFGTGFYQNTELVGRSTRYSDAVVIYSR